MRIKILAIGLAFVLPLLAISQTTTSATQKPQQVPPKPAQQQVKPTPVPVTPQATKPTAPQVVKPAVQQTKPSTAPQQTVKQSYGTDVSIVDRERVKLEPAERGGGHPYRELLNRQEHISTRHFSDQELEPRFLSTLLWEITSEQNPDGAYVEAVAEAAVAGGPAAARQVNTTRVLDVYVVTKEYIALYKRNEQVLEIITRGNDGEYNEVRKNILGMSNTFAERAPVILIYVASNKKLSRIALNKRDFHAAMDCGITVQSANLFCASEHLVTTTIEVDPVVVGKILGLKADKVLLAQPIGFR